MHHLFVFFILYFLFLLKLLGFGGMSPIICTPLSLIFFFLETQLKFFPNLWTFKGSSVTKYWPTFGTPKSCPGPSIFQSASKLLAPLPYLSYIPKKGRPQIRKFSFLTFFLLPYSSTSTEWLAWTSSSSSSSVYLVFLANCMRCGLSLKNYLFISSCLKIAPSLSGKCFWNWNFYGAISWQAWKRA